MKELPQFALMIFELGSGLSLKFCSSYESEKISNQPGNLRPFLKSEMVGTVYWRRINLMLGTTIKPYKVRPILSTKRIRSSSNKAKDFYCNFLPERTYCGPEGRICRAVYDTFLETATCSDERHNRLATFDFFWRQQLQERATTRRYMVWENTREDTGIKEPATSTHI